MAKVSIIMNCLNGRKYLAEAIESIAQQTYQDWEIIFWDNGSSDDSAKIAAKFGEKVKIFRTGETVPLGAARNRALEKASGEFIAFLDVDDIWLPQKLELQVPVFDDPAIGLVYGDTYFFNDTGYKCQLYDKRQMPQGSIFRQLLQSYWISLETVMIRKKALESLSHWFDPRFQAIEEADLFLRIAHDWQIAYVAQPLGMWRMHAQSWTFKNKMLFPQEKEEMLAKFATLYPGFERDYGQEINQMRANIAYSYALVEWENKNNSAVRRYLSPYLGANKKYLFPWLLSWLPYSWYQGLLRLKPGTKLTPV